MRYLRKVNTRWRWIFSGGVGKCAMSFVIARQEWQKNAELSELAKTYTIRLFRMRSDRDAINNDALTDPMAGGRPHESHDLTFSRVCARRSIES